ncbi:MAG: mandelate racemase/muconate lactonizing enzyme family protein [Rhizobiales bacterium]|nr:mandelate racemase/muconate lactonizing enzyme family protein [Hyphomicrobiales bacterium]
MKITALETIRPAEKPSVIWVQVHTDEGMTGLGESWFGAAAIEADVHDRIAPLLLGEDVAGIERLTRKITPYTGFYGTGAEMRGVSAVDVALWDIAGKRAGVPVCQLLGGPYRPAIKVYNTCAGPDYVSKTSDVRPGNFGLGGGGDLKGQRFEDLDGFMNRPEEVAAELLEMGISSMKIWPFDFAEGAGDGADISTADLKTAMVPFERIRKAHGDAMAIKAELHGLWTVPAAIKIASALEDIEPDWIEDPIWMDRIEDLAEVASATNAPIAGGETLGGLGQIRSLVAGGGVAVPIIDVTWGGGITFAKKAGALAEAHALPIAFHDCSGPVTLAASTHLALACPNVAEQEITRAFYYGWYHDYVDEPAPLENGMIRVSGRPGLGLELVEGLRERDGALVRQTAA